MRPGRRLVLFLAASGATACASSEARDVPAERPDVEAAALPETPAFGPGRAAPEIAPGPGDEAGPPAAHVAGELVLPPEPLVADRPFTLALRLRNDGRVEILLRPRPDGPEPAGTLRLRRGDEPVGEMALSTAGWKTVFGDEPASLAPGADLTFELARLRAPTASGAIRLAVEYALVDAGGAPLPVEIPPAEVRVTWTGLTVVHIGDSQVANGLTQGLARRVREAGGRYVSAGWVSSNAARWLGADRLRDLLHDQLPEIVLVTLGTNEYLVGDLEHYLANYERLAARVGGPRRCFWIGPPGLPGIDRFVEAARTRTAPCPYFDSRRIEPDSGRSRDHLSAARGEEWAEAIWDWIGTQWRP